MSSIEKYLKLLGYKTVNIDYPSTKYSLNELIDLVYKKINKEIDLSTMKSDSKIHFVGHSMGGLITRGIISKYPIKNLGRVVQLGTPNHGSKIAGNFEKLKLFGLIYGPAGYQLTTKDDNRKGLFKPINYELGSLAGNKNINPLGLMLDGDNDGTVSVESTKVEGMKDHHIIKASHIFFPFYTEAKYQTAYFLQTGHFHKNNLNILN